LTSTGKRKKDVKKIVNIINTSKTFPHRNDLTEKLAENLYPFDPLAGAVLTLALQTLQLTHKHTQPLWVKTQLS
jgi:hypothetical protein